MSDTTETAQVIERVAQILGESGTVIVQHYTEWHLIAACTWVLLGTALIVTAFKLNFDHWDKTESAVIKAAMVLVGGTALGLNVADIVAPQAIAMHQLIKDIRG